MHEVSVRPTNVFKRLSNPSGLLIAYLGFGAGTMPCLEDRLTRLRIPVLLLVGEDDSKFIAINQRMHLMLPSSYLSIVNRSWPSRALGRPKNLAERNRTFISQL